MIFDSPEARESMARSFEFYERPIRIRNYKLGAFLAGVFMPAGASLDYFMYGLEVTKSFFVVRVISAVLLAGVWLALHYFPNTHTLSFDRPSRGADPTRCHLMDDLLPGWCHLALLRGAEPDHARLRHLVALDRGGRRPDLPSHAIDLLSRRHCMASSRSTACFQQSLFPWWSPVFIIAGSWYYNIIRQSEFQLRYRLDANRAELEESNQSCGSLMRPKSRFFANISHELRTPLPH